MVHTHGNVFYFELAFRSDGDGSYLEGLVVHNDGDDVAYLDRLAGHSDGDVSHLELAVHTGGDVSHLELAVHTEGDVSPLELAVHTDSDVSYLDRLAVHTDGDVSYLAGPAVHTDGDVSYLDGLAVHGNMEEVGATLDWGEVETVRAILLQAQTDWYAPVSQPVNHHSQPINQTGPLAPPPLSQAFAQSVT